MLESAQPTLPSTFYFDPEHYQRELGAIWLRDWICIGHLSEWPEPGDFRLIRLAGQQVIITRSREGALKAFHNTCRHRGSVLCTGDSGKFHGDRIVCPYHAWVYSLEGDLQLAPRREKTPDFDPAGYSLYPVHVDTWRGFVFVNLAEMPEASLLPSLGDEIEILAAWPLENLVMAHQETHQVACNWKVFWENFLECYHCPGVHPDLCRLVPVYGQGYDSSADLPESSSLKNEPGRLAGEAVTWSTDGQTPLPWFESLGPEQQAAGMTFLSLAPGVYVIGHVDHVRSVRVLPLGPESTQLTVSWFLPPATLAGGEVDAERLTGFARQVVMEDKRACELNQQGLRCSRHQHGVLMPQEYDVLAFGRWVRERLAAAGPAAQAGEGA